MIKESGMKKIESNKESIANKIALGSFDIHDYIDPNDLISFEYKVDLPQLELNSKANKYELDSINGKSLHKALNHLDKSILYDKRFWNLLALTEYKDYIKERITHNTKNKDKWEDRFARLGLFKEQPLRRNYLARLYWITEKCGYYDGKYNDKLISSSFHRIDEISQVLERSMGNSNKISYAFAHYIESLNGKKDRTFTTKVAKRFNHFLSNNVVDLKTIDEIIEIINKLHSDIEKNNH